MAEPSTIGVVVIARDAMPHLAATLDAIAAQTVAPVDVVVVDGRSTDGSREHAAARPGVRVIDQMGTGIGNARNEGIAAIEGDLIAFCDADDRWPTRSLATRLAAMTGGVGVVIGALVTETLADESVPEHRVGQLGEVTAGLTPGAVLVRRSVLDRIGPFDEQLRIGADSDWLIRMRDAEVRVETIPDVVLHKGVRTGSLSVDVAAYRAELLAAARAHVRRSR